MFCAFSCLHLVRLLVFETASLLPFLVLSCRPYKSACSKLSPVLALLSESDHSKLSILVFMYSWLTSSNVLVLAAMIFQCFCLPLYWHLHLPCKGWPAARLWKFLFVVTYSWLSSADRVRFCVTLLRLWPPSRRLQLRKARWLIRRSSLPTSAGHEMSWGTIGRDRIMPAKCLMSRHDPAQTIAVGFELSMILFAPAFL